MARRGTHGARPRLPPEEEEVEIADARLRSLAFSAPFDQARRKAN